MTTALVVDANELFSFFKEGSVRKVLIEESLPQNEYELISPAYVLGELFRDKEKIIKFSGIDEAAFAVMFSLVTLHVSPVPEDECSEFMPEAAQLAPHSKDAPYFAAALARNCTIWSDEKAFKKQDKVKVVTTAELLEELKDFSNTNV